MEFGKSKERFGGIKISKVVFIRLLIGLCGCAETTTRKKNENANIEVKEKNSKLTVLHQAECLFKSTNKNHKRCTQK